LSSIITLMTDFGRDSPYVAAMKGVILATNPAATIVDITHSVAPQNIAEGAFVLGETTRWFPTGSIHVAVVDPGVGSERKIVYARVGEQQYVCPDNGLLSYVCRDRAPDAAFELTNRSFFLPQISNTFHGRDIMSPVAARLSMGLDSFGNLVTNIVRSDLPGDIDSGAVTVEFGGRGIKTVVRTYSDAQPGETVALIGSSGLLEVAIVQGNAARHLPLGVGDRVNVCW
jgi:S-adenosylmethionine hydrolase